MRKSVLQRSFMLAFLLVLTLGFSAPWAVSEQEALPVFHPGPPPAGAEVPPVLGKEQLVKEGYTEPAQTHAYELASRIPNVLYQQPCYCHCDRNHGHKSLHTCFETAHGAMCGTCMSEVFYSYKMSRQHKSAAVIRKGIIAGEWKQIDLKSASSIN